MPVPQRQEVQEVLWPRGEPAPRPDGVNKWYRFTGREGLGSEAESSRLRPQMIIPCSILYTALYMSTSTRTQIYLTVEQRKRLDALASRDQKTLAQVIRDAVDRYLAEEQPAVGETLATTFGVAPELVVPWRDEWDRVDRPAR